MSPRICVSVCFPDIKHTSLQWRDRWVLGDYIAIRTQLSLSRKSVSRKVPLNFYLYIYLFSPTKAHFLTVKESVSTRRLSIRGTQLSPTQRGVSRNVLHGGGIIRKVPLKLLFSFIYLFILLIYLFIYYFSFFIISAIQHTSLQWKGRWVFGD